MDRNPKKPTRRGYALVSAIALTVLILISGTALLSLASTSRRMALKRTATAEALNVAMGGVEAAIIELKSNDLYPGFNSRTLGGGQATVVVTTPAGQPNRRVVTGTGTVTRNRFTTTKTVVAYVDTVPIPQIFLRTVVSQENFTISGNTDVLSAPALNRAQVHSNGNLRLNGTPVDIYGTATASGTVTQTGNGTVTGAMTSGAPAVDFPPVDQAFKDLALYNGSVNGNRTVSDGSLVKGKINGSLTVGAPGGCRISGVVWVTGNLTLSGPVRGIGTLVCDGTITVNSNTAVPYDPNDSVTIITTSTSNSAISITGNTQYTASFYAPYGGIQMHGNAGLTVSGGLYARTVNTTGRCTITFRTDLPAQPPPLPRIFEMRGWEEI